jgi:hypothetical protein
MAHPAFSKCILERKGSIIQVWTIAPSRNVSRYLPTCRDDWLSQLDHHIDKNNSQCLVEEP